MVWQGLNGDQDVPFGAEHFIDICCYGNSIDSQLNEIAWNNGRGLLWAQYFALRFLFDNLWLLKGALVPVYDNSI